MKRRAGSVKFRDYSSAGDDIDIEPHRRPFLSPNVRSKNKQLMRQLEEVYFPKVLLDDDLKEEPETEHAPTARFSFKVLKENVALEFKRLRNPFSSVEKLIATRIASKVLSSAQEFKRNVPAQVRFLSAALVPASAALFRRVLRAGLGSLNAESKLASTILGAAAGFYGREYLLKRLKLHTVDILDVTPTVAAALNRIKKRGPLLELSRREIEEDAQMEWVTEGNYRELFAMIFADIVEMYACAPDSELIEYTDRLEAFVSALNFTQIEVGSGISLAAVDLGVNVPKDEWGFFVVDDTHEMRRKGAKLLFLIDRLIGRLDGFFGKQALTALCAFELASYREYINQIFEDLGENSIYATFKNAGMKVAYNDSLDFLIPSNNVVATLPYSRVLEASKLAGRSICNVNLTDSIRAAIEKIVQRALNDTRQGELFSIASCYNLLSCATQDLNISAEDSFLNQTIKRLTRIPFHDTVFKFLERSNEYSASVLSSEIKMAMSDYLMDFNETAQLLGGFISTKNMHFEAELEAVYSLNPSTLTETLSNMVREHALFLSKMQALYREICKPGARIPVRALLLPPDMTEDLRHFLSGDEGIEDSVIQRLAAGSTNDDKSDPASALFPFFSGLFRKNAFSNYSKSSYELLLNYSSVSIEEWKRNYSIKVYSKEVERLAKVETVEKSMEDEFEDMLRYADDTSRFQSHGDGEDLEDDSTTENLMEQSNIYKPSEYGPKVEIPLDADMERLRNYRLFMQCDAAGLANFHSLYFGENIIQAASALFDIHAKRETTKDDIDKVQYMMGQMKKLSGYLDFPTEYFEELLLIGAMRRMDSIAYNLTQLRRRDANLPRDKMRIFSDNNEEFVVPLELEGTFMDKSLSLIQAVQATMDALGINWIQEDFLNGGAVTTLVNCARAAEPEEIAEVYKFFVWNRLLERNSQLRVVYAKNEKLFGAILGIKPEYISKLVSDVFSDLVKDAVNDALDKLIAHNSDESIPRDIVENTLSDVEWLTSNLPMRSKAKATEVFIGVAQSCIRLRIESMFGGGSSNPTQTDDIMPLIPSEKYRYVSAATVRKFRMLVRILSVKLYVFASSNLYLYSGTRFEYR